MRVKTSSWVVAVSMGYGHQRTAYPLRDLADSGEILNINDYPGMPAHERNLWKRSRRGYEFISRTEQIPLIGKFIFAIFDFFQSIPRFYPKRLHLRPTLQLRQTLSLIRRGWGEHFIHMISRTPKPLVTTFFTPAYMAEAFNYPGQIFCIVCDADISRTWVPEHPTETRIHYFAPTAHVADRLMQYGLPKERITITGYPLPKENLGSKKYEIARHDLANRIANLDPERIYRKQYGKLVTEWAGTVPATSDHPLTLLFSLGGAGAQMDIVQKALRSLRVLLLNHTLRFIIAAGTRGDTKFKLSKILIAESLAEQVEIISDTDTMRYFQKFNTALRTTDILWTKPSELSFYAGLGIPILIAPPLGSHEELNKEWLLKIGAGIPQDDPQFIDEWLFDYVKAGNFAEAAIEGFIEIEKGGTFAIERIVEDRKHAAHYAYQSP